MEHCKHCEYPIRDGVCACGKKPPTKEPRKIGLLAQFFWRFWGRSYPVRDVIELQAQHGRLGSHIEVEWTTVDHWAHNNYERTHLPQLCVRASGWKARVIALILWPKAPWKAYQQNQ